jgi:hypothetical protein
MGGEREATVLKKLHDFDSRVFRDFDVSADA